MKTSIAITLIITIAVFSFVSGYSISVHNKMTPVSNVATQRNISNVGTATAGEYTSETSGGYGTPSPGYGQ